MRRWLLSLTLGAAYGLGSLAHAQAPGDGGVSEADRTAIANCVRESSETPRACIGTIAVVCMRSGGEDRREADIACSRREARVWRERLEVATRALAQGLDSGARSRLAGVQRSWDSYVSQKCAFAGEIQPPARAPGTQAACELREAALRSIELERLGSRRGANRSGRPEIFR